MIGSAVDGLHHAVSHTPMFLETWKEGAWLSGAARCQESVTAEASAGGFPRGGGSRLGLCSSTWLCPLRTEQAAPQPVRRSLWPRSSFLALPLFSRLPGEDRRQQGMAWDPTGNHST